MVKSMVLSEPFTLVDDGFPPTHKGVRFTKDLSMVDVMDVFMFV